MLLLEVVVKLLFVMLSSLSCVLVPNLSIELFLDQSLSFLLSKDGLLLLFIVEQGVEVLNCRPLVFLVQIRVLSWRSAGLRNGVDVRVVVFSLLGLFLLLG